MAPRPSRERRVVVTGMGAVTPLGIDVASTWDAATEGRSGIGPLSRFDASGFSVRICGEVSKGIDLGGVSHKEARRLDRNIVLAVAAAREAREDADFEVTDANRERIGVAIGTAIGGLGTLETGFEVLSERGPERISPFMIPMIISNMAGGYVAIRHGLRGPNLCHVSACATGAHSIGEAAWIIERGDADVMLAGGTECAITRLGLAGFAAMRALSKRNDDPAAASRPFDRDRDGLVMGEGAAVLILEELEHARARGATIRAELLGYGMSADAVHIAVPSEDAEGAQRCMKLAIQDAGIAPEDVDYINAHATGTPAGDPTEVLAIRQVFGSHADTLAVSATKSMTGHLLGAAGAVEALLCIRALETGVLPPTINLEKPDPECDLDHVANKARQLRIQVALSNSFGFGGTNATLIFGRA
ncbi:MAG: beta-ketoacyl-ACP synthase II [Myxococcales bacterium]|nr:beta-ketoacyl-ACP synthase II [Myxococcales bacterium]